MKKFKVLIVDDEKIIRDGISKVVDWESIGLELQGALEDAYDALDVFDVNPPDLVITDIKMPGLTGLDLIRIVREKGFDTPFIILSGYSDFAFAQNAISYGVKQYLLKPVNPDKLVNSLITIRDELIESNKTRRAGLNSLFEGIIKERQHENNLNKLLCRDLDLKEELLWLIIIDGNDFDNFSFTEDESIQDSSNSVKLRIGIEFNGQYLLLSTVPPSCKSEVLSLYIETIPTLLHCSEKLPTMAAGTPGTIDKLRNQYLEAKEKIIISKLGRETISDESGIQKEFQQKLQSLSRFISLKDFNQSKQTIEDIFNYFLKENISIEKIVKVLVYFLLQLKSSSSASVNLEVFEKGISLLKIENLLFLKKSFCKYINEIINLDLKKESNNSYPDLVNQTIKAVRNHYSENNLSLRWLCTNIVFSNPDYLGKLFHKHVGMTFNEYLNSVRVNSAKESIIADPFISIFDVAMQAGYGDNAQYLCRVFKKVAGISPGKYRELVQKGVLQ